MRFLNRTARPGFRWLSLALLAASAYASGISSTPTTLNVTNTFEGGDIIESGYVNLTLAESHNGFDAIIFDDDANLGSGAILTPDLYLDGALQSDAQGDLYLAGTDPNPNVLIAPEPSTAMLAIAGSVVFVALRRRKRRA